MPEDDPNRKAIQKVHYGEWHILADMGNREEANLVKLSAEVMDIPTESKE